VGDEPGGTKTSDGRASARKREEKARLLFSIGGKKRRSLPARVSPPPSSTRKKKGGDQGEREKSPLQKFAWAGGRVEPLPEGRGRNVLLQIATHREKKEEGCLNRGRTTEENRSPRRGKGGERKGQFHI